MVGRVAQVDLALLPVDVDPTRRAPQRDLRRHLALRLVGPVHRQLGGRAVRRSTASRTPRPRSPGRRPDRARCRRRRSARRGTRSAGRAGGRRSRRGSRRPPRACCARCCPCRAARPARRPRRARGVTRPMAPSVEEPLDLGEGTDEPVVVADLGHQAALRGERGELVRLRGREAQRLLAEHVEAPLECRCAPCRRGTSARRGDDDGVELDLVEHRRVVGEGAQSRCTWSGRRGRSRWSRRRRRRVTSGWVPIIDRWDSPILPRPTTPTRTFGRLRRLLARPGDQAWMSTSWSPC